MTPRRTAAPNTQRRSAPTVGPADATTRARLSVKFKNLDAVAGGLDRHQPVITPA